MEKVYPFHTFVSRMNCIDHDKDLTLVSSSDWETLALKAEIERYMVTGDSDVTWDDVTLTTSLPQFRKALELDVECPVTVSWGCDWNFEMTSYLPLAHIVAVSV